MTEFDLREALQQLVDLRQFQGNTIDFLQAMDQVLGYFKTPLDETSKLHYCLKGLRKDMREKVLLKGDGSEWQSYTELRTHLLKIASVYDRKQSAQTQTGATTSANPNPVGVSGRVDRLLSGRRVLSCVSCARDVW